MRILLLLGIFSLLACQTRGGQETEAGRALSSRTGLYECNFGLDRLLLLNADGTGLWDDHEVTWLEDDDDEVELIYDNEDPRCDVQLIEVGTERVAAALFCRRGEFGRCLIVGARGPSGEPSEPLGVFECERDGPGEGARTIERWDFAADGRLTRTTEITSAFGSGSNTLTSAWIKDPASARVVVMTSPITTEMDVDDELTLEGGEVCPRVTP